MFVSLLFDDCFIDCDQRKQFFRKQSPDVKYPLKIYDREAVYKCFND